MKKFFAILLCLCVVPAASSSALTAFAKNAETTVAAVDTEDDNDMPFVEYWGDSTDVEDYYLGGGTHYDFTNEVDTPAEPEAEEDVNDELEDELTLNPATDTELDDMFTDYTFDDENNRQLKSRYVLDEIIVKFVDPSQVPGKEKQLRQEIAKMEKLHFVDQLGVYVVKEDELNKNPNAILNKLKNNKYIEYVEPNYILTCDIVPNDTKYIAQSVYADLINAPAGWDILEGDSSAWIAVIDTGMASHPDLPSPPNGYSVQSGYSPYNDAYGHGTKVAGVLGAIGNNSIGTAGINWNASIVPIKIDGDNGLVTAINLAKGIIWAADNGIKVINISAGTAADGLTLRNAINYAYEKGCAIFAAVGNEGQAGIMYPARYPNVMGVGSATSAQTRYSRSNYGPGIDVVASSTYYSTINSGEYGGVAGTSIATPQVAGLASLVWGIDTSLTNEQVYEIIRQGASGNGAYINDDIGYGLINVAKSLQLAGGAPVSDDPQLPLPPETPQEARTPPVITLAGFHELTLEYGQTYLEMGYTAVDCYGVDLTEFVKVTNKVNIKAAGLYSIIYEVADEAGLTVRVTRSVTVNPQPASPPPAQAPKITIIGSNPIILHQTSSTPYKEQSARAIDYDGTDISSLVKISGLIKRTVADTYTLTYSVTSPKTGLTATATRNVRIVAPTQKKDPRMSYGLNGQAKQGAKVTHTGIVSGALGFMDLTISSIDKNMSITVELVDTATKKAVLTDTYTAVGSKQYKIDKGQYELAVSINKANGNSKYAVSLLMPETTTLVYINDDEVPLGSVSARSRPQITLIGANPIILHLGGSAYIEQGARAVDCLGRDISDKIVITGTPDISAAGTYTVTYTITDDMGFEAAATREVRVLAPSINFIFEEEEIPLGMAADLGGFITYVVVEGDNLSLIAQKFYNDSRCWRDIYEINKRVIGNDPNRIYAGQALTIKRN